MGNVIAAATAVTKATIAAATMEPRSQVCMSFTILEEKRLIKKYKAYVAKCTGTKIMAKATWAKMVLLS